MMILPNLTRQVVTMFRPIKPPQKEIRQLKKKIQELIYNHIYLSLLNPSFQPLDNAADSVLEAAFRRGTAYYSDGYVITKTGRYSSELAKALEELRAVYKGKAYYLPELPKNLQAIVAQYTTGATEFTKRIMNLKGLDAVQLKLFERELTPLLERVGEIVIANIDKNLQENRFPAISFDITDKQAKQITKEYTKSLLKPIKGWSDEQTAKMRQDILRMLDEAKHPQVIRDYLKNRYNIDKRKAAFWARNECANYVSTLKKSEYEKNGFTMFRWLTHIDGRERELHKKYNGLEFSFDSPPVIDSRTGKTGLPGQTYNCRCTFIPIIKGFKA
jgi:SPP1 gp7 family putative phage head morphogenesis protein